MQSNNPVFGRTEGFSASRAGVDAASPRAGQLEDMYAAPSATPVQTGRMTYDDVVVKTGITFAVLLVGAVIGWQLPGLFWIGMIVGLVLGLEMSRLARSSKDWHHLLELCALFGTLLGDQDGVYNPTDSNDRLLLGLKGTMSEFELFTMRNRLQRGLVHKAERGELHIAPPLGYERPPSGEVVLDSDEQVRGVIQLIFDKFDELGSARRVLVYLVRNNIRRDMGPCCGF